MQTILITGSSSGIGKSTAELFLKNNWKVIGLSKDSSGIIDNNFQEFICDTTDYPKLEQIINSIVSNNKISVVFSNAGYGYLAPVENASLDEVRKQFEVNFFSYVFIVQKFLPEFRKIGGGTIIITSSMMGKISLPFFNFYSASKWALEGLFENIRYELKNTNIKVKLIEPGTIKTDFVKNEVRPTNFGDSYYKQYFQNVMSNIDAKLMNGVSPELVAKKVWKAANSSNSKFRYPVDFISYFLIFNKWALPLNIYQSIIKKVIR